MSCPTADLGGMVLNRLVFWQISCGLYGHCAKEQARTAGEIRDKGWRRSVDHTQDIENGPERDLSGMLLPP